MVDVARRGPEVVRALLPIVFLLGCNAALTTPTGVNLGCESAADCPTELVCAPHLGRCLALAVVTSCDGKVDGEACSYPGVDDGICGTGVCYPAGCGNGLRDPDEVCDDANRSSGDGCSADCRSDETCGNDIVDTLGGEGCDDGNLDDGDGCQSDCATAACGDGIVDALFFEACDDGAANSTAVDAACRPNCQARRCGDGVQDTDEVCDDGNVLSTDGCSADCGSDESCPNGVLDAVMGETCDDGNAVDGDGCQGACTLPRCGDGILDAQYFELCDAEAANSDAADASCRTNCQPRRCGDGIIDLVHGEVCDDGNVLPGDGCSGLCQAEICGDGFVDVMRVDGAFLPKEECDDANLVLSHDGCTPSCEREPFRWRRYVQRIPAAYTTHALAYDASRGRVVLFGGYVDGASGPDAYSGQTLEWDGVAWVEVAAQGPRPSNRRGHAMVYDAGRQRVVLFGGEDPWSELDDTWEWDGSRWFEVTPLGENPPPRVEHGLAYDAARQRVVLFGGVRRPGPGDVYETETWEWDGVGWSLMTTDEDPGPRYGFGMTYDAKRARTVVFGGSWSGILAPEVWEWDGLDWRDATPTVNPLAARAGLQLVYDAWRERVIFYGGRETEAPGDYPGDGWSWDGETWEPLTMGATTPGERGEYAATFDVMRGRMILYGGSVYSTGPNNETWEWDGAAWHGPLGGAGLTPRHMAAAVYDPRRAEVVLFGGFTNNPARDTWVRRGHGWIDVTPQGPGVDNPPARSQHALAYDLDAGLTVLFGGLEDPDPLADTWVWNGSVWDDVTPVAGNPPARRLAQIAYDEARGRVVLFGGYDSAYEKLADTWLWDGVDWADVTPATDNPPARAYHGMAYDVSRQRLVLFGGSDDNDDLLADVWEWDGTVWRDETPLVPGPRARSDFAMAYDTLRQRVIVSGGFVGGGSEPTDDAWLWDGSTWLEIVPATPGPVRQDHPLAFDGRRAAMLVIGGNDGSDDFGDTWELRPERPDRPGDSCHTARIDSDADGALGCADPDCWARCTPLCPPTQDDWPTSCDASAPRCGDGLCEAVREDCALCPADCGACAVRCGDYFCDPPEGTASCPGDCLP